MAQHRTREELIDKALDAIKQYKLIFITDVPKFINLSTARFYQLELEKVEDIKNALEENRIDIKVGLRKKWWESENPTLQIMLFKLVSTDEERKRVSTQYTDITSKDEKINTGSQFAKMPDEEIARIGEELAKLHQAKHVDEVEDDEEQTSE